MALMCCVDEKVYDIDYLAQALNKPKEEIIAMTACKPCGSEAVTIYQGYALCKKCFNRVIEVELAKKIKHSQ